MRFDPCLSVLAALFVPFTVGRATEEHLLTVFQALATTPDVEIGPVSFVTWYGALEETTIDAMAWPAVLPSPHEEAVAENLNWASLLGVKLRLSRDPEDAWRLTMDLTGLQPIPEKAGRERLEEETGRAYLIERMVEAAQRNLKEVGVFDCRLVLEGQEKHEDLADLTCPATLNALADAWGHWAYTVLPRSHPEGDLVELAARSLVRREGLQTLFMILSSGTYDAEGEAERNDFLRKLLGRHGDAAFAGAIEAAEPAVRERVMGALTKPPAQEPDGGIGWRSLFPQTFGHAGAQP